MRTKQEVLKDFKEIHPDWLKDNRFDYPAKREAWYNWTDALCKDGKITSGQKDNCTQPF